MGRIIGIVHRVKQTKEGAARPTRVWIDSGAGYDLKTETDELDWLLGRYPVKFDPAVEGETIDCPYPWQIVKDDEGVVNKVPAEWDGLKPGDTVLMACGGSGDLLAYAIAKHCKKIGAEILRIASARLKGERVENTKANDAQLLVSVYAQKPEFFQMTGPRELDLIRVSASFYSRQAAMKERIGFDQRLSQRLHRKFFGEIFLSDGEDYPTGILEEQFEADRAENPVLLITKRDLVSIIQNCSAWLEGFKPPEGFSEAFASRVIEKSETMKSREEAVWEKELKKAVHLLPVWTKIFEPLEGVGELIAARLISSVGDIRRFDNDSKFKAYLGVHVLPKGIFPRHRNGKAANWSGDARQAMYLLGDQFNRRPDSVWGKELLKYKARLRATHPDILCQQCGKPWDKCESKKTHKRIYSNGHIHRMAIWRTLTKFAESLFRDWRRLYDDVGTREENKKAA